MNALPSSIEAALLEADFSGTEIIILKRLMEEDAMTLRQLALKTGKSTGVLDQAMKKLLKKGIVNKETINDNPKYVLQSLQSISRWMERDMEEKQDMLMRRHKNFETFIATLSVDKERPEMEHFEGEEGMKKAFIKLMDYGEEMLVYMPMAYKEEEDPLRDFRVQLFRERRHRGIFQRVIVHESPLGRRFQTRDMFEYRKTILVPEPAVPITFEQIIVGDMYACFDHDAKKAVFIRFPHLAQSERSFFEALWQSPHREITIHEVETRQIQPEKTTAAAFKTRFFSSFREFILSRKSIAALAVIAVLSGALTYGLYQYTQALTLQRMKDQVRAVAATAASQFNPEDLNALRTEVDWQKPEWAKVVGQLRDIRVNNPDLLFTYIFRKSQASPSGVEFVADSHSLNPYANTDSDPLNDVDSNQNGIIEPEGQDKLSPPSDPYPIVPREARAALGSISPSTNEDFYEDSWGKVITGYAPIRNSNEEIVAVLAVDMEANKLNEFSGRVFQPLIFFVILFIVFIAIRITAMNRSLVQEFMRTITLRNWLSGAALLILLIIGLIYAYQRYQFLRTVDETGRRMQAVAVTSALEFSAEDLQQIQWAKDMKTDAYQRVFKKLNEIRTRNPEIQYAVILRPVNLEQKMWEFVADADSNHFLPSDSDLNGDDALSEADENPAPGTMYYMISDELNEHALREPFHGVDPIPDQWGRFLSATAPIYDAQGKAVAALMFSIELSKLQEGTDEGLRLSLFTAEELVGSVRVFAYFFVLFFALLLVRFITLRRSKDEADEVRTISRKGILLHRKTITLFGLIVVVLIGLIWGFRVVSQHSAKREVGERLKSIAATAAPEFDPADIEQIHWARDMKTVAYQRLFTKLNDVRNRNPEILFAYIFRPTSNPEIVQFVADADTNHVLPFYVRDFNQDGKFSNSDTSAPPGAHYDFQGDAAISNGFLRPSFGGVYTDQWGTYITACAPILNKGQVIAVFCVDMDVNKI
jgi:predicted transcriptional regulator